METVHENNEQQEHVSNETNGQNSISPVYCKDIFEDTLPWPLNLIRKLYLIFHPQNRGQRTCK